MEQLSSPRTVSPWAPHRLASLWPGRVAVVDPDGDRRYTYDDLHHRSLGIAVGLADLGVAKGDRVATLMLNGVEHIDLLFACAYLGAILAPLNWRLSKRELQDLVGDLEPRVVVASPEYASMAAQIAPEACLIGLDGSLAVSYEHLLRSSGTLPAVSVEMEDPWLILYTGGTTGIPKGAILTHGSITWNAVNTALSWGLSETDIGPNFTPMFHTGGWNVFTLPLLLLGGRVLLPRRFEPTAALALVARERPTILFMVPTMFQIVSEQPTFGGTDFTSLRWVISGGAPLPDSVRERWQSKVRVFKQGYGLTEAGPNNFATPDCDAVRKSGTVGRLTQFAQARIVDDMGHAVPDGQPGDLQLRGPHMYAGYWRRPSETAEAIHDGWFQTGDVARRDDEGYYYIVDRKKDMIITGGENVYPTEVENVLYGYPGVREVAVVGLPDPMWGEAVTAVIAFDPGATVTSDELRAYTRSNLAPYKVPKSFTFVDDLPKSAAGKILRAEARALVQCDHHAASVAKCDAENRSSA